MRPTPHSQIERLIRAARKYDRTLRAFNCRYNQKTGLYDYTVVVAKRHSGSRGGHIRGQHVYTLNNLYPIQREAIRGIPAEPGCAQFISQK